MKIAVIGAGPAGLMAAASVNRCSGDEIWIFDRNEKAGKKLYITGKGRCNFTNLCEPADFLKKVVNNRKFLSSAVYSFSPASAISFLEQSGCRSKTERGNRVFPVSDKASDVTKALLFAAEKNGAKVLYSSDIIKIYPTEKQIVLITESGEKVFDRVIIATGGKSYPSTGSNGDGYRLACSLGHSLIDPRPSLVSFHLKEDVKSLQGLSLKNVSVSVSAGGKRISEFGEMLFTGWGVSGPIILTLSAFLSRNDISDTKLCIDFKPALDEKQLGERLLRDFAAEPNRQLKNLMPGLLPKSMAEYFILAAGIDGDKQVNSVTREERKKIAENLKSFEFTIKHAGGFEEAVVTSGGISTKEINPSTMESKIVPGIYFAGEIIDVDALTGGYNIQIALSTGFLAGKHSSTAS